MAKQFIPYRSMAAALVAAAATPAEAHVLVGAHDKARQMADVRTYRHCHTTPRRTYCHTLERLPVTVRFRVQAQAGMPPDTLLAADSA